MFCPNCKTEYKEGFEICSDCNVRLVSELTEEKEEEFIDYKEVLSTFNPIDIAFIKSMLDSENITYYFHGEHFTYVRPWVEPARLMVKKDQAETVRELLKDVKLSYMAVNPDNENRKRDEDT